MTLRMCIRTVLFGFVGLFAFAFAAQAVESASEGKSAAEIGAYKITDIKSEKNDKGFVVRVIGSGPPTFTMYELFDPTRIVLDLADGVFVNTLTLPKDLAEGPVSSINGKILDDKKPAIARLEIFMADDLDYRAEREGNDIIIIFNEKAVAKKATEVEITEKIKDVAASSEESSEVVDDSVKQEEGGDVAPLTSEQVEIVPEKISDATEDAFPEMASETDSQSASFKMAGYDRQAITIDFYKIDLHNVFRLFGEISGLNIVVTEGVGGTLTLALNNVPWDFALDLILNLKDLQKIERHGTLIIAPKAMEMKFTEQPTDNLKVKTAVDSLTIKKSAAGKGQQESVQGQGGETTVVSGKDAISKEIGEAKKKIMLAREKEKTGDNEQAFSLYEEAYALWPANNRLANRIAAHYLVNEGMNAKALHYAKLALKNDENDRSATLYAAVSLANMKRNREAREYFDLAVREIETLGPSGAEALMSYASFNEGNGDYVSALLLLVQHDDLYGETIDTMIAKARIYDKEGNTQKAVEEYRSILLSGYKLPPDLARYINGRLAMEESTKEQNK